VVWHSFANQCANAEVFSVTCHLYNVNIAQVGLFVCKHIAALEKHISTVPDACALKLIMFRGYYFSLSVLFIL
jgi:hypothetical protein